MSTTVIDALIVTLGLDPGAYKKGATEATKAQSDLEAKVVASTKRMTEAEKKSADAKRQYEKEAELRAKSVADGIRKIRNEALALFAVFTGGVGLTKFMQNSVTSASNLGRLSDNLQVSTQRLTAWQQASERAGGSAEGAIAQLKESAETAALFRRGMSNSGMQSFFQNGGSDTALRDGNTYLMARADIVKRLVDAGDPQQAMLQAKAMGISEDQFNLIKQGSAGLETLLKAREKYAKYTREDADAADKLRTKVLDVRDAFEQTTAKLLTRITPALTALADEFLKLGNWIGGNNEAIGKWFDKLVEDGVPAVTGFVEALRDADWKKIGDGIGVVGNAIVLIAKGIVSAADGYERLFGARDKKPAAPGSTRLGSTSFGTHEAMVENEIRNGRKPRGQSSGGPITSGNKDLAMKKFIAMGWTPEQAAGMVGSLMQESGMNPDAVNAKSGARGISQWLGSRVKDFEKFAGRKLEGSSLDQQLEFHHYELTQGSERAAGDRLRRTKTESDAAYVHRKYYERPGEAEANDARRQSLAEQVLLDHRQANAANAPTVVGAAGTRSTPGTAAGNQVSSETHIGKIEIQTAATDAAGIASSIGPALRRFGIVAQINTGLA